MYVIIEDRYRWTIGIACGVAKDRMEGVESGLHCYDWFFCTKNITKEDVEMASVAAHDFCVRNGMDKKTANYTALCIEEMTMNIVEHGFSKFNDNEIDVRLIKSHDKMIIRIRDNGKSFDPVKFLNMYRGKAVDPTKNIGINMIFSLVKNVNYINTLGLNSLMLEL